MKTESPYDNKFYNYINTGAVISAQSVVPLVLNLLKVESVMDIGCGQGAWLSVWSKMGVADVVGIDGNYINRDQLLIHDEQFLAHDLSTSINLGRKFDLVQSLEVAEHIEQCHSEVFIKNLVCHGDVILFSAAAKGQGGDNHVNEQDYEYWRSLFKRNDYVPIDCIRGEIKADKQIEAWYRYNTFLYVNKKILSELPEKIKAMRVDDNDSLLDISPALYKFRKLVVRCLPVSVMTKIAKLKESFVIAMR